MHFLKFSVDFALRKWRVKIKNYNKIKQYDFLNFVVIPNILFLRIAGERNIYLGFKRKRDTKRSGKIKK